MKTDEGYPFEYFRLQNNSIFVKYEGMTWPGEFGDKDDEAGTYRFYEVGEFFWCPRYLEDEEEWDSGTFRQCWVDKCVNDNSDSFSLEWTANYD